MLAKVLHIPVHNACKSNNGLWVVMEFYSKEDLDITATTIMDSNKWFKNQSYQLYGLLLHWFGSVLILYKASMVLSLPAPQSTRADKCGSGTNTHVMLPQVHGVLKDLGIHNISIEIIQDPNTNLSKGCFCKVLVG